MLIQNIHLLRRLVVRNRNTNIASMIIQNTLINKTDNFRVSLDNVNNGSYLQLIELYFIRAFRALRVFRTFDFKIQRGFRRDLGAPPVGTGGSGGGGGEGTKAIVIRSGIEIGRRLVFTEARSNNSFRTTIMHGEFLKILASRAGSEKPEHVIT